MVVTSPQGENMKCGADSPYWKGGRKASKRRHYEKNKDKIKANLVQWRQDNPDKRKEQTKRYREKYKDILKLNLREYWSKHKDKKAMIDLIDHTQNKTANNARMFFNYWGIKISRGDKEMVALYKAYKQAEGQLKGA